MGFEILCCFYSEFHTEKGAEIIFQLPLDYIKQEDFLKISEFVIPRTELCDNLVSLKLGNSYLMGYPIHLKNPNYERAKFQFNFCLLISDIEYEKNFLVYELLLKKIAKTFETIEIDGEYEFIKFNRHIILTFIEKLSKCLINKGEIISIHIDGKSINSCEENYGNFYFFFKFIDFSKAKIEVSPYQVPVWIKCIDDKDLNYFENSVKLFLEQIDGLTYIKKLSSKLDYDLNYAIFIIYNLLIIDCIALVDIFQFSNIYRATPLLKTFYRKSLLDEFTNFCRLNLLLYNNESKYKNVNEVYNFNIIDNGTNNNLEINKDLNENAKIALNDVSLFSLYCELSNAIDVSDFINKINNYGLILPLFVAFGVYKKIIRRVQIYGYNKNKDNKEQGSHE